MKSVAWLVVIVLLIFATAADHSLALRLEVLRAHPDFLLVVLGCVGMYLSPGASALLGFACGTAYGAVAGVAIGAMAASRTLASLVPTATNSVELERNLLTVAGCVVVTSIVAQLLMLFLAPQPSILSFLTATIRTAIYNGVIAVPVFLIVHPIFEPLARKKK